MRPLSREPDQVWTFPKGKSVYDVDWLGVISRKKRVSTRRGP